MIRPRIIPCLLIHQKGLVKTIQFKNPKYVGDPINTVRLFTEKEADEIMIIDIDATVEKKTPNLEMIKKITMESNMPLLYGGGIATLEQAKQIIKLGVEKIAISSAAVNNLNILNQISDAIGSQSVVIVLDVKKKKLSNDYQIFTHNGKVNTKILLKQFLKKLKEYSFGELILNSIDNDGIMKGYDLKLIQIAKKELNIPITLLGGAGSLEHLKLAVGKDKNMGLAAGSLFIFKGIYRAVLINYPSYKEKNAIFL